MKVQMAVYIYKITKDYTRQNGNWYHVTKEVRIMCSPDFI